ncbi:MAG: ABC transporter permease [Chloroflexota bacterium]|nr:ABC transporter permease [Chloroflexota bacterium]
MSQATAIVALMKRDLRAFLRSRSQLYSSVLFPLMLLAILGTGVSDGLDPKHIRDYVTFLTPGMIAMTAVFSSTFSSASYYQDRDSGVLKVLLASPHSPRVVLLGKTLSAVIIGAVQALLVLAVAAAIPAIHFQWQYGVGWSLLAAVFAIVVLNLFLSGLGQLLASKIRTMQGFHLVMNLVLFPFLFFSGAFFPLTDLPVWLKVLGRLNPLSYGVDMMHLALYANGGGGYFGLPMDLGVLTALAVAVFYFGTSRSVSPDR